MGRFRFPFVFGLLLFLILQGSFLFSLTPDSDVIVLTLWTAVSNTIPSGEEESRTASFEELSRNMLLDACWILSGMIYGFDIRYVPLDTERNIEEIFTVDLRAEVPFGDSSLNVTDSRYENGRFIIQVRYELADFQLRRIALWNSNIYPEAEGLGKASFFEGEEALIDSVKDGIKIALRNYFRARIRNKPREITGKVLLDQPPYIIIDAGGYSSKTRIKLSVDSVIPYTIY